MTMYDTSPRGSFNRDQIAQLLKAVAPSRIVKGAHVKPHLSQQDVLAHLSRVFGFGHFDIEVIEAVCLYEEPIENAKGKPAWSVGYRAQARLYVRDEQQRLVTILDGGSTGESEGQPSRAASHDLAYKSALSTAMKRAAIALGDQFGLSLYNKGQESALVLGTMVDVTHSGDDVQEGVQQQLADGGRESDRDDAEPVEEAPAPRASRAKTGTQGTRRKAPTPEPTPEPEPAPTPVESAPVVTPEPAAPADGDGPSAAERIATVQHADLPEPVSPHDAPPEPTEPEYTVEPSGEIVYTDSEPWAAEAPIPYDASWAFPERARWLHEFGDDTEVARQLWLDWQNSPTVAFDQAAKDLVLKAKAEIERRAAEGTPAVLADQP